MVDYTYPIGHSLDVDWLFPGGLIPRLWLIPRLVTRCQVVRDITVNSGAFNVNTAAANTAQEAVGVGVDIVDQQYINVSKCKHM